MSAACRSVPALARAVGGGQEVAKGCGVDTATDPTGSGQGSGSGAGSGSGSGFGSGSGSGSM